MYLKVRTEYTADSQSDQILGILKGDQSMQNC